MLNWYISQLRTQEVIALSSSAKDFEGELSDGNTTSGFTESTSDSEYYILIVDDDEQFVDDLISIWSPPLPIHIVRSGRECHAFFENHARPALVLLDIELPHYFSEIDSDEGFFILHFIKEHVSAEIPVIVASNFNTPEMASRAIELGAKIFLPKPFAVSELDNAVRAVIKGCI